MPCGRRHVAAGHRLRTTSQLLDPVYNLSPLKSREHDGIAPRDRTVLPGAAGVYHSSGCHRLETRRRESVRPPAIALGFAAGAMIYVVFEELIPSARQSGRADLVTIAAIGGFTLMMVLHVALGG